tara:strand:+ start:1008 stop:1688 length:681 start_codon:yes stop_codon:yes gene_type:complete
MARKIFITGCAKTGTTLLLRMCFGFKDTEVAYRTGFNGHELPLSEFVNLDSDKRFLIGKRLPPCVLSNLEEPEFEDQIEWIRKNDIGIINVIRDGRDVVLSDGNYVKPERYLSAMKQREKYSDIIDYEVRYEDLVKSPNRIQENISNIFGIQRKDHFSNYPEYVDDWVFDWNVSVLARAGKGDKTDYGKRKLSAKGIGRNRDAYKDICTPEELVSFEEELKKAGYT